MDFFETLVFDILSTTWLEWLAVGTGVLYVVFAAARYIICWFFALVSSMIYVWLCIEYNLYIESVLQLIYVIMAIMGWWSWSQMRNLRREETTGGITNIQRWGIKNHLFMILVSSAATVTLGFVFDYFTNQQSPYMDAFTTSFSLSATYMVTRKVLENWVYWIIIDTVSILLYSSRGLQLTAVLYFVFTILAVIGLVSWHRKWKKVTQAEM